MQRLQRLVRSATTGAFLASIAACAAAGPPSSGPRSGGARLEASDFRKPEFRTMYDAIRILRPDWLQVRGGAKTFGGGTEAAALGVFIEGQARGHPIEKLEELAPVNVLRARRILASEAMAAYGTTWAWGGIVITLQR